MPPTAKLLQHIIAGAALLAWLPLTLAAPPLSRAEFDAITTEAVEVYRQSHRPDTFRHPPIPQWRNLDREKLARLLEMPEFITLGNSTKEPLIDQAGAWEMIPFDSPAAALTQWEKWLATRGIRCRRAAAMRPGPTPITPITAGRPKPVPTWR